jgi:hypothetical protein
VPPPTPGEHRVGSQRQPKARRSSRQAARGAWHRHWLPAGSFRSNFGDRVAISGNTLIEHSSAAGPAYGIAVAISGKFALVGYNLYPANSASKDFDSGRVYVFAKTGKKWKRAATLEASDLSESAEFGSSVAISGDTAVIGAPGFNSNTGRAYVFARTGKKWKQTAELTSSDASLEADFGDSVAVSGTTAVIASPDSDVVPLGGHAYVFAKSGSTWKQTAELSATVTGAGGDIDFGAAVAISGATALISAPEQDTYGRVYFFARTAGAWKLVSKLSGTHGAVRDGFGASMAISGSTAIVNAPGKESKPDHAFLYGKSPSSWKLIAQLKGSKRRNQLSVLGGALRQDRRGGRPVRGYGRTYIFRA